MPDVSDIAAAWAEKIARDNAHGYDQGSRWGPDYDCSSLVISAYKQAGVPLTCTYTGNMKADMLAKGFKDVTKKITLKTGKGLIRGDVLLHETHHTAMYVGDGKVLHAAGNEYGKATGGKTGDQTGKEICTTAYFNFPWEYVLRYEDTPHQSPKATASPQGEALYTVKTGDSLWGIAERELGNGLRYEELRKLNGLADYWIYPGQVLKLPGEGKPGGDTSSAGQSPAPSPQGEGGPSGTPAPTDTPELESVTVTMKKTVLEKMRKAATARGITIAALIEEAFQ